MRAKIPNNAPPEAGRKENELWEKAVKIISKMAISMR
jgi:hypothetical protein